MKQKNKDILLIILGIIILLSLATFTTASVGLVNKKCYVFNTTTVCLGNETTGTYIDYSWIMNGPSASGNYTNGTGLDLVTTTFSILPSYQLPQGCSVGQTINWTGTNFQCTDQASGGSGGTVTSITRGFGFNFSGTNITTTGTIDINASIFQRRDSASNCNGQVVVGQYENGSFICETDNSGISAETDPIFVGVFGTENTTIVRSGSSVCSGQKTENITINTSGVFAQCSTDLTGSSPDYGINISNNNISMHAKMDRLNFTTTEDNASQALVITILQNDNVTQASLISNLQTDNGTQAGLISTALIQANNAGSNASYVNQSLGNLSRIQANDNGTLTLAIASKASTGAKTDAKLCSWDNTLSLINCTTDTPSGTFNYNTYFDQIINKTSDVTHNTVNTSYLIINNNTFSNGDVSIFKLVENDFLSQGGSSTQMNEPFFSTAMSSGTQTATNGDACHIGVNAIDTSTTASSGYVYATQTTIMLLNGSEFTCAIFAPYDKTGNTTVIQFGFLDSVSTTTPTDGVYFQIQNTTDGRLLASGIARRNNLQDNTSTNFSLKNITFIKACVFINSSGRSATFMIWNSTCIDKNLIWSGAINTPTYFPLDTGRQTGVGFKAYTVGATTVQRVAVIDYINFGINRRLLR